MLFKVERRVSGVRGDGLEYGQLLTRFPDLSFPQLCESPGTNTLPDSWEIYNTHSLNLSEIRTKTYTKTA